MAGVFVTLAMNTSAFAQGKSQQSHGNNSHASSPSQSTLLTPTSVAGPTGAAPFAWIDNANLMTPGSVWLGISMVRWQGNGLSEVSVPVIDGALGLASRVQLGASVPRIAGSSDPAGPQGGLGTTFFSTKIAVLRDNARGLNVAVAPTLEILGRAAMPSAPIGQSRAKWGLPVSVGLDRGARRIYGSTGYFSPGVWYAGAGTATQLGERVGVSISFSRAWTTSSAAAIAAPRRNEISGGVAVDLKPTVGVFGSIGRTVATAAENGAGTTISIGLSLTAGPIVFAKKSGRAASPVRVK